MACEFSRRWGCWLRCSEGCFQGCLSRSQCPLVLGWNLEKSLDLAPSEEPKSLQTCEMGGLGWKWSQRGCCEVKKTCLNDSLEASEAEFSDSYQLGSFGESIYDGEDDGFNLRFREPGNKVECNVEHVGHARHPIKSLLRNGYHQ